MTGLRFFVTGTDTGVGKTEVSAALLSSMADLKPFAFKPCESGDNADSEALRKAAGSWQSPESVCLYRFKAPLAPGIAARKERRRVEWKHVLAGFRALGSGPGVVEGAGGLFVPLDDQHDVIDLIEATQLPVVLVARAGLGTINHTVLSLNALAQRKITVAAVVLVQAVDRPEPSMKSNRPELERRFPGIDFLGPVGFEANAVLRRERLRLALSPTLSPAGRGRK